MDDPHIVLQLRHVLLSCRLLGESPRQHEFGFEDCARWLNDAIERGCHPFMDGMADARLSVPNGLTCVALVPAAVELLGDGPELNDEIAGKILRLELAAFFAPETDEIFFIITHDDTGIRSANEIPAIVAIEPDD